VSDERFHPASEAERCRMVATTLKLRHVDIGPFRVCDMGPGRLWLQHRGGEGMECADTAIEELLSKFWQENF
jgi:hypothetical protein